LGEEAAPSPHSFLLLHRFVALSRKGEGATTASQPG
jgi:hypothetical protein